MTGADNLAMLGRAIGGLVVVLVLIALIARLARRRAGRAGGNGLRVVERLGLSREANLAVIEVSNRTLLLGVTAQGVTMLADLDGGPAASTDDEPAAPVPAAAEVPAPPVPAQPGPTRLDLTGLERGTVAAATTPGSRPRSASPVGTSRRAAQEIVGPVPNGLALDEYPDLASALRAAGRTTGSTDADSATTTPTAPRTRAEARAQGALTSSSSGSARARTRTPKEKAPKPGELKVTRIDDAASGTPPVAGRVQASGSVLSPRTWRQGVDALRELTVRRG